MIVTMLGVTWKIRSWKTGKVPFRPLFVYKSQALSSLGTTGKKALNELKMWGNTITDNDLAFTLSHMDMIPTYGTSGRCSSYVLVHDL